MFELSVALKYLIPRWRQLSVSIISLISVLVITLVVWLILVFFSVTNGLEHSWIQKLISLTAPVRVTPTEAYYNSYYYKIDTISSDSDYSLKTIGEKLESAQTNPYDPEFDEEIPSDWPSPERNDLVKEAFDSIRSIPNVTARDFELTVSNLRLQLVRDSHSNEPTTSALSQASYIGSLDEDNPSLAKSILPVTEEDLQNAREFIADLDPSTFCVQCEPKVVLPSNPIAGDGVLLPKGFKDSGVLIGDRGYLSYFTPTTSSVQEQRIPIFVAGFYDPGILPMGGKFVIASHEVTTLIRTSHNEDTAVSNGINVRFNDLDSAESVKDKIVQAFQEKGIDQYWHVETFREYEFTKDMLQQLRSEKHLFMIIATVIIIVACSNIISMLIILVNDKKKEIGILRSMGATSRSIATIFGFCGFVMGIIGSLMGIAIAIFTLKNLQSLVDFLSAAQGFEAFNPVFYGDSLPNEISFEALVFVLVSTGLISLFAGIVPAVKASLLQPTETLRAE